MKSVLIVMYHFLPAHNVGVQQWVGYAKYLRKFGWEPVFLTNDWSHGLGDKSEAWGLSMERELFSEIPDVKILSVADPGYRNRLWNFHERLKTHRRPAIGLLRRALSAGYPLFGPFPDPYVGWVKPAVAEASRYLRSHRVHAILSNSPPDTNHLVASRLARYHGLPWVPCFGDLFSFEIESRCYPNSVHRKLAAQLCRRWLSPATAVGAVSPAMAQYLQDRYGVPGHLIVVGFDPSRYKSSRPPTDKFRILHAGSLYPGAQKFELFFDGMELLLSESPNFGRELEILFVGSKQNELLRVLLRGKKIEPVCQIREKTSPRKILELQASSHVLLAFSVAPTSTYGTMSYPSKLFDAWGANRPILLVPGDGDWVDSLLTSTFSGTVASSEREVARVLSSWIQSWQQSSELPHHPDQVKFEPFTQEAQARRLSQLLSHA